MKKKLAIFTVAVGFFTLCNVILYTRKLRAEEMVSFWRWSIMAVEGNGKSSNDSASSVYSAANDHHESRNTSATTTTAAHAVHSVGQKKQRAWSSVHVGRGNEGGRVTIGAASQSATKDTNSTNALGKTTTTASIVVNGKLISAETAAAATFQNGSIVTLADSSVSSMLTTTTTTTGSSSSPSSSWSFIEAILNRTYRYNVNDSTVCVEVSLPHNRNFSVTFNLSLIEDQLGAVDSSSVVTSLPTIASTGDLNSSLSNSSSVPSGWTVSTTPSPPPPPPMSPMPSKNTYHVSRKPPDGIVVTKTRGLSLLNRHPFSYLVNVHDLCRSSSSGGGGGGNRTNLTLVILVTTAIGHAAQRQAIRETWGGLAKNLPDVRLAFLMGRPEHSTNEAEILEEALKYADIVQEDFVDTYKNLTLKTVMLLKWVNAYCSNTRYVMKSDDDMFVNVPNLLKYLRSMRYGRGQLLGRLVKGAKPLRTKSSKYYVPVSEYKDRVYPDYLSGTAYVMSSDVVPRLYSAAQTTPIFFFEDVFVTGICAKKAKVIRRNHSGFVYYKRPVKGCAYVRAISGHDNTPSDLRKIWRELQRKNLKC